MAPLFLPWGTRKLEDEIFLGLCDEDISFLLTKAIEIKGSELIDQNIKSASDNGHDLESVTSQITPDVREILASAAGKKRGWFKSISAMEEISRDIVGPGLEKAEPIFRQKVDEVLTWILNGANQD